MIFTKKTSVLAALAVSNLASVFGAGVCYPSMIDTECSGSDNFGNTFTSGVVGTIEECLQVTLTAGNGDFYNVVDFPFYQETGTNSCVMVPGAAPLGDCCSDADCFTCSIRYNSDACPEPHTSYFNDYYGAAMGNGCTALTTNSGGDPHIQSFNGKYFDYMGECDLVLIHAPALDLDIHIRTKARYEYSFIESSALRIGDNILEVSSHGQYALDGVALADLSGAKLGEFPIHYSNPSDNRHVFEVVVGPHQTITLSTFKDLVSVKTSEAAKKYFDDSVGLMGSFSGELLSRDGTPMSVEGDDVNAFGQEWQVLPEEPMLFMAARAPLAGEKCVLPAAGAAATKKRRLGESKISLAAAESACSDYSKVQAKFDNCVFDVMAVGDLELAQAGAY